MQNPPKRWEIFTSKKDVKVFIGSQKFSGDLAEKNDGGNGDMEVPVREFEGVKKSVAPKMNKKKKKEKRSKEVRSRSKRVKHK